MLILLNEGKEENNVKSGMWGMLHATQTWVPANQLSKLELISFTSLLYLWPRMLHFILTHYVTQSLLILLYVRSSFKEKSRQDVALFGKIGFPGRQSKSLSI